MYINNNNNRNMSRNSFQRSNKPAAVEEFSLKSILFPELPELLDKDSNDTSSVSSVTNSVNSVTINYKSMLLTQVPENYVPVVRIKEKTEHELEIEKKRAYHNKASKVIDMMNKKWLDFRLNYIEMWGEDEYEKWYIPLSEWNKAIIGEYDDDDESEIESSGDEENCDY
jgi:hypothetical protein